MTDVTTQIRKAKWRRTGKVIGKQALSMLAQLIPVAVGVYLGIVASDWNTERKQKATQKEFLNNLYLEMLSNKSKIKKAVIYHNKMKNTADSVRGVLNKEVLTNGFWASGGWKLTPGWLGPQIPMLESSVYQTGIIVNTLSGLDFKTINTIAHVYTQQDEYKPLTEKLFADKVLVASSESTEKVLGTFSWLHDVLAVENLLIAEYEKSLKQVKTKAATL